MSGDDPTRRRVLRAAATSATGLALASIGATAASGTAACDGATESTTRTGTLAGADDAATLAYDARTADPCEVVVALSSADATDFDLYVTYDGRTPTTSDYDARSRSSLTSAETVTVGADALDADATLGVLVDSYTAGGDYTVTFEETSASDGGGGNTAPTASFTASATTVSPGVAVEFDASASSDDDGTVETYDWTFGDGATATGVTASHAYDAAGEYDVTLTVTDDDGATATTTRTVTVESGGGECDVTRTRTEQGTLDATGDATAYTYRALTATPCEVTLSLSADAGTDFDLYVTYDGRTPTTSDYDERSYNYGSDEEIVVDGAEFGDGVGLGVLVNSYDGSGAYTLAFKEAGSGDGSSPDPNDPPTAAFSLDASTVSPGESVSVDAADSSDPDGAIESYEWTFGDGTTASGVTASHAYETAGEYDVTLAVTDDDGAGATATRTVTVESAGGDCGRVSETASTEGSFWWYGGSDDYTYDPQTAEPCRMTVELDGPSDADFDLYCTTDGRTPTTDDYDARSAGTGSDETVTLDAVDAATSVGILVVAASGAGSYGLAVEELGR